MVFNLTPAPAPAPPPVSYNLAGSSLAPSITPDFTGLLPPPPPPPSSHVVPSRPPPQLLSLSPLNIPSPRSVSPLQSPRQSSHPPLQVSLPPQASQPPLQMSLSSPHVPLSSPQVQLSSPQVPLSSPQVPLSPQVSITSPQMSFTSHQVSLTSPQVSLTSPALLSSPQNTCYKAPPPPYQSPPSYQTPSESSPDTKSQEASPPPYPGQTQPAKLPSYSLEELKDLPGANLKKSTVDLTTYINAMAQNKHPNFENVDSFAERCLACIVRKIKSNLPTLKALLDSSLAWRGDWADPGCVLIPRMKDGRITISRVGGGPTGAAGTKKIHPHLALVQIFKQPAVVNHNCLVSVAQCVAPFSRPGDEGEREMVCISPMHYNLDNGKLKSPLTPRKKVSNQISSGSVLPRTQQSESSRVGNKAAKLDEKKISFKSDEESDSDLLSDSDDDGVDWAQRWRERVRCESTQVQQFQVNDLVRQIKLISVEANSELVDTDVDLIERLKIP